MPIEEHEHSDGRMMSHQWRKIRREWKRRCVLIDETFFEFYWPGLDFHFWEDYTRWPVLTRVLHVYQSEETWPMKQSIAKNF